LGLSLGADPAFAFKNIEGCDIAAFASQSSPVPIAPERWQSYREEVAAILDTGPASQASLQEWRAVAMRLIEAQKRLLAPERESKAHRDYLAGDSCRVLAKLDTGAIQTLLDKVAQSAPEATATALRRVTKAARTQIDRIERSARFRSGKDRTAMAAQYYCFVAGAIVALLPPEGRETIALENFGDTVACKDIGRAP
jgi:hypothetical protein